MTRMTDYLQVVSHLVCVFAQPKVKCTFHDYMGLYIALKSVECTYLLAMYIN
jgi:hypothetical protein